VPYKDILNKRAAEKVNRKTIRFKDWQKKYRKQYHQKKRLEILVMAGGLKCKKSGFDDWRALQIDHVNGNGSQERNIMRNAKNYKDLISSNPLKYQVLCANCNWIKRYENNETYKKI